MAAMNIKQDENIIRQRIAEGRMTAGQFFVIAICFILNTLDGFDIVAMSVSAPALVEAWGIAPTQKGYILGAALAGWAAGAMFLAPLSDKYGRRTMILIAAIVTGSMMLLTGILPHSVALMILVRFITGLGVGVIMASTTALTAEFTPERWRNLAVPVVVVGFPFGALVTGPVAAWLLPYGWETLFFTGGFCTLLIAFLMYLLLPESVSYLANKKGDVAERLAQVNKLLARIKCAPIDALPPPVQGVAAAKVSSLLVPANRLLTLKIWLIFFVSLLNLYFILTWLPSLFESNNFARADSLRAFTYFTLGSVLGVLALGFITIKTSLSKPIALFFIISALTMFYFAYLGGTELWISYILLFIIGFVFAGGYTAMYTVAARAYPAIIRATGVGWAIGLGRIGGILAPIITGLLVDIGWTIGPLFVFFGTPILLAALLVYTIDA